MNIGIDIDGVLTNLENYIATIGKKFTILNNLGFDDKMSQNSIYGFLKKEDSHAFWDKHWFDYAKNIPARPNCSQIINKLKQEGNNIIIITARTYDSQIIKYGIKKQKEMEQEIINWLQNNNINYDKLIFSDINKLKNCIDNNIDIMIEDSISNIEQLKKHMKIICFNAKYNKVYKDRNLLRVDNWENIYQLISNNQ